MAGRSQSCRKSGVIKGALFLQDLIEIRADHVHERFFILCFVDLAR